jgi:endonuclease/exonuclease/phosphatase family metal-dependent hydrolase
MRIVSWNVAGRRAKLPDQAAAVLGVGPDVVCLQEVTPNSLPEWRAQLAGAGFDAGVCPLDDATPPKPRRLGVLTAARTPLDRIDLPELPWFERAVAVDLGGATLLNVHSPISPSPHLAKVITHETLYAWVRDRAPAIVVGDLNTPRRDLEDGTVLTFAHTSRGTVRAERGERWVAAERALVQTLKLEHGWRDAFEGGFERTWQYPRFQGGYRLDHCLVKDVEVTARAYAHDWRLDGLSDHSAVVVDLAWALASPA